MRLFKQFGYALTKNDPEGVIISRIFDLLNNFRENCDQMNTLFYLSDMGENFKSAVDKIVKAHPYLKSFEFINSDMITPPKKCLSNFSIEWDEGNPNSTSMPIPNEVLLEIAVGIPNPYLLSCATFIFNAIDWYRDGRNCNHKPIPNLLRLSRSWKSKKPLAAVSHSGPQFPHTFLSSSALSVKGSIIKTFNKRGYNYYSNYSGQGIYTIAKKTDYNSQIRLMFDIGSHGGGRLSCTYFYEGHLWSVSFELIICKETPHKTGYYSDQNDIDRILENVGIITDFLEKTLIIELIKIFGRVPLWYQYQK